MTAVNILVRPQGHPLTVLTESIQTVNKGDEMRSGKAVLIHGRHVETDGWEQVVLGDLANGLLGTMTRGVLEAYRQNADLIYFGTGASKKDDLLESEYTYQMVVHHWFKLAKLCGVEEFDPRENAFQQWLQRVSFLDTVTQNTTEEVRRCLDLCVEQNIDELTLVSAPFHLPRCLQQAKIVLEGLRNDPRYRNLERNLKGISSDVNPTGMATGDVVIVEPMHRGDNPKVPFYKQVRRIFQFLRTPDVAFEFCDALTELIDRFEKRLKSKQA